MPSNPQINSEVGSGMATCRIWPGPLGVINHDVPFEGGLRHVVGVGRSRVISVEADFQRPGEFGKVRHMQQIAIEFATVNELPLRLPVPT